MTTIEIKALLDRLTAIERQVAQIALRVHQLAARSGGEV